MSVHHRISHHINYYPKLQFQKTKSHKYRNVVGFKKVNCNSLKISFSFFSFRPHLPVANKAPLAAKLSPHDWKGSSAYIWPYKHCLLWASCLWTYITMCRFRDWGTKVAWLFSWITASFRLPDSPASPSPPFLPPPSSPLSVTPPSNTRW